MNRREQSFHVRFTLWGDSDEVIIERTVNIASLPPEEEYTVLDFPNLVRVTNGGEIEARVELDGETYEQTYEISCNQSEDDENNLFFRILSLGDGQ